MYVVLIGRPGVGKGTQSKRLAELLGALHLATGDLLRDAKREDSPLAERIANAIDNGNLVPDALVMDLVRERLADAAASNGCIFDGIPRTVQQAELLGQLLSERGERIDLAMELVVDDDLATSRMLQRAREEGRPDDTPETIQHRMRVYAEKTYPLLEYYRNRGVLQSLDGSGSPDEVFEAIKNCASQAQRS